MAYVEVDVDLSDFDTDDLMAELEKRRDCVVLDYDVYQEMLGKIKSFPDIVDGFAFEEAVYKFHLGYIKDAMEYLERAVPGFRGISEHVTGSNK